MGMKRCFLEGVKSLTNETESGPRALVPGCTAPISTGGEAEPKPISSGYEVEEQ
jgi:hypothetical protein